MGLLHLALPSLLGLVVYGIDRVAARTTRAGVGPSEGEGPPRCIRVRAVSPGRGPVLLAAGHEITSDTSAPVELTLGDVLLRAVPGPAASHAAGGDATGDPSGLPAGALLRPLGGAPLVAAPSPGTWRYGRRHLAARLAEGGGDGGVVTLPRGGRPVVLEVDEDDAFWIVGVLSSPPARPPYRCDAVLDLLPWRGAYLVSTTRPDPTALDAAPEHWIVLAPLLVGIALFAAVPVVGELLWALGIALAAAYVVVRLAVVADARRPPALPPASDQPGGAASEQQRNPTS